MALRRAQSIAIHAQGAAIHSALADAYGMHGTAIAANVRIYASETRSNGPNGFANLSLDVFT
jgi:hypothetical protein